MASLELRSTQQIAAHNPAMCPAKHPRGPLWMSTGGPFATEPFSPAVTDAAGRVLPQQLNPQAHHMSATLQYQMVLKRVGSSSSNRITNELPTQKRVETFRNHYIERKSLQKCSSFFVVVRRCLTPNRQHTSSKLPRSHRPTPKVMPNHFAFLRRMSLRRCSGQVSQVTSR